MFDSGIGGLADLIERENALEKRIATYYDGFTTKDIGDIGESLVHGHECMRIKIGGREDLIHLIKRIPTQFAVGYDISSVELDERKRYIEVKTTISSKPLHFNRIHLTKNEWNTASSTHDRYYVYRLLLSKNDRKLFLLQDPVGLYKKDMIEVKKTDNNQDVFLVTKYGQCIRFKETDVRKTGRTSMGVIGMNLTDGDEVIGMQMQSQGDALMIVSEKGLGKCTLISEFTTQNRGGKGVKCYKITEKTGNIVGVKAVNQDNELMLITTEGIIIRIKVSDTTLLGRITSGVKLINLDENVTVASIAKVREDKSLIDNADTSELLSEEEEKESAAIAAENAKKASVENTETDDELMKELLERAEADGSEDEEE